MSLEELYPEIRDAHVYSKHRKYSNALQVYVDILNDINQDSEEYCSVLLEYAQCLLESIMVQSELNYLKILQTRSQIDEEAIEEDLENCWESLEICRISFTDLNKRDKLCEVHKGLGDVLCLKNQFEEGKREYLSALDFADDDETCIEILECVADCCRSLKKYDDCVGFYRQIKDVYARMNMKEMEEEYDILIDETIRAEAANKQESKKAKMDKDDATKEPINVNHLKK